MLEQGEALMTSADEAYDRLHGVDGHTQAKALPPWQLKATVYTIAFSTKAGELPDHTYSPLEGASAYATSGKHVGGTSMVQIIRYSESPVGPYDELIISPGGFTYEEEDAKTGKRKTSKGARITRIYVSHKHTCFNGRVSR